MCRLCFLIAFAFTLAASAPARADLASRFVCFNENCFYTIAAPLLIDPGNAYKYQDPAGYPNKNLQSQYEAPSRFIDLQNLDPLLPLSQNFVLGDFMDVSRGRYGLFSPTVALTLQSMRDELGKTITINSGYRSPGHNADTGGSAQWSRHMYGDAVDFTTADADYSRLQALCTKYGASFTLIYKEHIHCDWRLWPLDSHFYNHTAAVDQARENLASDLAAQVEIVVTQEDATTIELAAKWPELELENERDAPIYLWSVTPPTGRPIIADANAIALPKLSGAYNIKLQIGGSITVERTLQNIGSR